MPKIKGVKVVKKTTPKRKNLKGKFTSMGGMPLPSKIKTTPARIIKSKPHPNFSSHHVAACSITDPFCVHAKGAKRPDGMGANAIGIRVHGIQGTPVDATGSSLIVLAPGYGRYGVAAGNLAAGTFTLAANFGSFTGSDILDAHAKEVRIVSFGVMVRSIVDAATSRGYFTVATLSKPVLGGAYTQYRQDYAEAQIHSLASGTSVAWVSKPIGNQAHEFANYATVDSATNTDFSWTSLLVEINGAAASSAPLLLEYYINLEITLTDGTATSLAQFVSPSKPVNKIAIAVQEKVQSTTPSFIDGAIDKVTSVIGNYAKNHLEDILTDVGAFLNFL